VAFAPDRRVDLLQAGAAVKAALTELASGRAIGRLWAHDPALWAAKPAQRREIAERLGWLTLPQTMREVVPELEQFAQEVRGEGTEHVVLCGMGGSSLAAEVFRQTFGSAPGFPQLIVLDSTDPAAVRGVDDAIDPTRTLFVVASKSGSTIEVLAFLAHFWDTAQADGTRFCAITDAGTGLEALARERHFRRVFLNPHDVGGRYSALSLFGLVPATLIGIDVRRLLQAADRERQLCESDDPQANPGAWLGAYIGGAAGSGRDKLTILASPGIASLGLWLEQLLSESTGKDGTGIVTVVGEPVGAPDVYGDDRAFVVLRLDGDVNDAIDRQVAAFAGRQPLVVSRLGDRYELGAEMYRWQVATALAAALLKVNAFDQPNVQETKDRTNRFLAEAAPDGTVVTVPLGLTLRISDTEALRSFLRQARPGDYVALHAYLTPTYETERSLQSLRAFIRDSLHVATTLGYGPRFLHSTGQLHKGGPPRGVFVQLTYPPTRDLPVPGQTYSFGALTAAAALGDLQSLHARGLPVVRVDLGDNPDYGLARLPVAATAGSSRPQQRELGVSLSGQPAGPSVERHTD